MLEVKFYELGEIDESLLGFAVIVCKHNGKWVYCKHKERDTWEIPGGHIDEGEAPLVAAERELREEAGASEFELLPLCIYAVVRDTESYGLLCYAKIEKFEELPDSEIGKIDFFDDEPQNLTYPKIQPKLFARVKESWK
jgi:8-oxo-dGTP diphosphatase